MKLAVSCGSNPWMIALARRFAREAPGETAGILIDRYFSPQNLSSQVRHRLKRYGFFGFCDQALLQLYLLFFEKEAHGSDAEPVPPSAVRTLEVSSMKAPKATEFLRSEKVDFLINIGAGLMPESVFSAPSVCAINIHPGIVPRYRGAGGILWALYEKNLEMVGVTAHKVDAKIDHGEILFQTRLKVNLGVDRYDDLIFRAYETGLRGVLDVLKDYHQTGKLPAPVPPLGEPRLYGWFGLSHYLKVKKFLSGKA